MSFLLDDCTGATETLSVWISSGINKFGQQEYTEALNFEGIWQDQDEIQDGQSDRQKYPDSVIHSVEYLEIGSWVVRGRSVSKTPTKDARQIKTRRVMKFLSQRDITYRYSL